MDEFYLGVCLSGSIKSYYFRTNIPDLKIGDNVVCDTAEGLAYGWVSTNPVPLSSYTGTLPLKDVLRKASPQDKVSFDYYKKESEKALPIVEKEIAKANLSMNLIDVNYSLDGSICLIRYTSDARVDFRPLLKILPPLLKARIEFRQISPRDRAKMVGGVGPCGRQLCCQTFLHHFENISIGKAKNQMLTLNIPKLSGACGKLACCLAYEDDLYTEEKKKFPEIGTEVKDGKNIYYVDTFNVLNEKITIKNKEETKTITLEEYNALKNKKNSFKENKRDR